ncbi:MAG TPA: paraquat-inducible protein A [Burkholderiales bacterium]|nr:paraquat-inducible protein A [Burkholderiales bacterium]
MNDAALIACHECDLLQREIPLAEKAAARCARCGAVLYRNQPGGVERGLAFAAAAAMLFLLANVFPLVGLRVGGELVQTTLFGAARAVYLNGMKTVGVLVLITTVIAPLIELAAILWLLGPLLTRKRPPAGAAVFRALRASQPWRMAEVMMLGVLVALVKLAHLAEIVPGIALWSLATLVVLTAATLSSFEPRELWQRLDASR